MTMPEGHAIWDCGAALDCLRGVAAARTAQAITAPGETRLTAVVDKTQRSKFGGDGSVVCWDIASPDWRHQDLDRSVCASWQHSSFALSTVALSASMFGEF